MARSYEDLLRLPVSLVLMVMWLAGSALVVSCVLVAYELLVRLTANLA